MFRWIGLMVLAKRLGSITESTAECWSPGEPRALGAAGRLDGMRTGPWCGESLTSTGSNWALLHWASTVTCECTGTHPSHSWGLCWQQSCGWMGLLNPGRWYKLFSLPLLGAAFPWALILWGSPRRIWLFPVLLKNLRDLCKKMRDDRLVQAKVGLGRYSGSLLKESSWGG